jgi:hypothetical protein
MNTVTANEALQAILTPLLTLTEIRDPAGNLLGYFAPPANKEKLLYQMAREHFDPAEKDRRKQSSEPGFTFEQVMDHLRSLEKKQCGGPSFGSGRREMI